MCRRICVVFFILVSMASIQEGFCQQVPSYSLKPMGTAIVEVSTNRITNLIFPGPVRTGIKVSNDIQMQKVKGVDNVIELKAMRKGFPPTGVSVFTSAGRVYSFQITYNGEAKDYDFAVADTSADPIGIPAHAAGIILSDMPVTGGELAAATDSIQRKGFMRRSVTREKIRFSLRGIFLKDSLMWLVFEVRNRSQIPYKVDYLRLYGMDRKQVKRAAAHETDIEAKYIPGLPVVGGRQASIFSIAYVPFTISDKQWLNIEIGEQGGERTIKLRLKSSILLKARK